VQDLLAAKTTIAAQTDRLLSHYRSQIAQYEAEVCWQSINICSYTVFLMQELVEGVDESHWFHVYVNKSVRAFLSTVKQIYTALWSNLPINLTLATI